MARRAAGEYEGSDLGAFLSRLAGEIEADRGALEEIMDVLGASRDRLKVAGAWVGEKVGRLKLNGELLHSSPLSPLVELEVLLLGMHGKHALWRTLRELDDDRLDGARLAELSERAERQAGELDEHRRDAAARAFA